jgi:hypothetical protein
MNESSKVGMWVNLYKEIISSAQDKHSSWSQDKVTGCVTLLRQYTQ